MQSLPSTAIPDDAPFAKLQPNGRFDKRFRHFEELSGKRVEFVRRQPAMAVVQRLRERVRNTGPDADHGGFLNAKPLGDCVGGLEADTADILRQTVGIFRHDLHGIVAVGLVDAHRPRSADAMGMKKDHDLAHDFLFSPGGHDALRAPGADAIHLAQALRRGLDHVEDLAAEYLIIRLA